MYTHLKERRYYENLYDKLTIETAHRGMEYYNKFLTEFESKLPKSEKLEKPGNAFLVNVFYMETVGNELIRRYEKREPTVSKWVAWDKKKDEWIAGARLSEEPHCHHCGKQGLRIIDKSKNLKSKQRSSQADEKNNTYTIKDKEGDNIML